MVAHGIHPAVIDARASFTPLPAHTVIEDRGSSDTNRAHDYDRLEIKQAGVS
jgi:hypothetical protein